MDLQDQLSKQCFMVQKSQEGKLVGEGCGHQQEGSDFLGGFAEGTELVPGKASAVCGSRPRDRTTVLPLFHETTVPGSRDKTRLPGAGWSLWDIPGMLVFRTRI